MWSIHVKENKREANKNSFVNRYVDLLGFQKIETNSYIIMQNSRYTREVQEVVAGNSDQVSRLAWGTNWIGYHIGVCSTNGIPVLLTLFVSRSQINIQQIKYNQNILFSHSSPSSSSLPFTSSVELFTAVLFDQAFFIASLPLSFIGSFFRLLIKIWA